MTGLGAGGERVRTVGRHGWHWRGHSSSGNGGTASASVVVRHVIMVFRTRPGQAVRVLIVGERVFVARRHHDHGSGEIWLRLVKVVATAVARMTLERVGLFFLVREELRLEV